MFRSTWFFDFFQDTCRRTVSATKHAKRDKMRGPK